MDLVTAEQTALLPADSLTTGQARRPRHYLKLVSLRLVRDKSFESTVKVVKSPADAADVFRPLLTDLPNEHLLVMCLDTRNRILSIETVYVGNLNTTVVRVGELFRSALLVNAAAVIVAHNHPSGDPSPSPEDVRVTEEIVKAGKLLDVDLLDHIIVGHELRFVSLKERGLGFH